MNASYLLLPLSCNRCRCTTTDASVSGSSSNRLYKVQGDACIPNYEAQHPDIVEALAQTRNPHPRAKSIKSPQPQQKSDEPRYSKPEIPKVESKRLQCCALPRITSSHSLLGVPNSTLLHRLHEKKNPATCKNKWKEMRPVTSNRIPGTPSKALHVEPEP